VGRGRWFRGRLALAAAGATGLATLAGALTWAGAASQNAGVSLPRLLEAGANCLPPVALFLALGLLAFALVPRASLVSLAFFWELLGALLDAPHWLVELSPFEDVGLVPAEPFRLGSALALLAIAVRRRPGRGSLSAMTLGPQIAQTVALAVSAALMMIFMASSKKLLRWKPAERRCRTCGKVQRHDCACRR
jgi:hypothetical protein